MTRAELLKRLDDLGRRYQTAPELPQIELSVIAVVPEGDPRLGSWEVLDDTPASFVRSVSFYCRDLHHFNQMTAEYRAEQQEGTRNDC